MELFVAEQDVHQDDAQFHQSADQGSHSSTHDAQLGRAEVAVDEAVVETDVDADGGAGHDRADHGGLHALEGVHEGVGQAEHRIGPADDLQVAHSFCDDRLIPSEQPQHPRRSQLRDGEKEDAAEKAALDSQRDDLLDGSRPLLPPVLGGQDDDAHADAGGDLLEGELELIDQGRPGQGQLGVTAQHDVVRQVHRQRRQLLEDDDEEQGEEGAVEGRVLHKNPQYLLLSVRRQHGIFFLPHVLAPLFFTRNSPIVHKKRPPGKGFLDFPPISPLYWTQLLRQKGWIPCTSPFTWTG